MKKVFLIIIVLSMMVSCEKHTPKDYAMLSGKIENATANEIKISARSGYKKTIKLNEDGTFSDTLHLSSKGEILMFSIDGVSRVFLKNDDDVKVSLDVKNPKESLNFTGTGSETSDYIAKKMFLQSQVDVNELFALDKPSFDKKASETIAKFQELLDNSKNLDSAFFAQEKIGLASLPKMLKEQYARMNAKQTANVSLVGKPSPLFTNYENYKGGTTSLKDLRGKYVYIDVWATWCRPCIVEIPHLHKLEEKFKGKDIHFVSISIDKENVKDKWKKMIKDKEMGGIQLFAPQNDSFIKEFKINSIPRFILIDPKGNIVNANAPRPSSPKTLELLTSLLK